MGGLFGSPNGERWYYREGGSGGRRPMEEERSEAVVVVLEDNSLRWFQRKTSVTAQVTTVAEDGR